MRNCHVEGCSQPPFGKTNYCLMHRDHKIKSDKLVKKKIKPFSKHSDETKVEGKFSMIIIILFGFSISLFITTFLGTPGAIVQILPIIIILGGIFIFVMGRKYGGRYYYLNDLEIIPYIAGVALDDIASDPKIREQLKSIDDEQKKSIDDSLKQIMEQDNFGKS